MTEKDIYSNGVALLEEWEDVNYCEHSFKFKDEWLTDKEVVDLLNELHEENKKLKQVNEMLQMDFAITERNLMEENEQLKQQLKSKERLIGAYEQFINDLKEDGVLDD